MSLTAFSGPIRPRFRADSGHASDTVTQRVAVGSDSVPPSGVKGGTRGGDIPLILLCGSEAPGMEEYPPGQRTHSGGEYHPTIIDFDPLFEHVIWINPDSKEIMNQGPYSPIRQGWMTKVRTNFYRLTPLGLAAAERLKGRVGETVGTARASQNVFDSLAKYIEHRAFRDYCRDPEEPRTWLGAAAFLGITKNEPRELADRICAAENTIKQASAWMDHERRDTIRRGPVGGSITIRRLDVERLAEFLNVLQSRFELQMGAIRKKSG